MSKFDYVVVGSSPVLMMAALRLSEEGKTVAIIEKAQNLGGAWRLEKLEEFGFVENSCHLIEWYLGGYKKLEQLSGVKFVPINPQPQKLNDENEIIPYTTKTDILKLLIGDLKGLLFSFIRIVIPGRFSRNTRKEDFFKNIAHFKFMFRYKYIGMFLFDSIKIPEFGYSAFVESILEKLKNSDVTIYKSELKRVNIKKDRIISFIDGQDIESKKVVIGDSSLTTIFIDDVSHTPTPIINENHHIIISIPNNDITYVNKYIQLPNNPTFHRVTNIDNHESRSHHGKTLFLVQLRKKPEEILHLDTELAKLFCGLGITRSNADIDILKVIDNSYNFSKDLQNRKLSHSRLIVLKTYGDLSRSVLLSDVYKI